MSHVDEGRLSEYLDRLIEGSEDRAIGESRDRAKIEAHLAECAECRERLEDVRTVRERAAALLQVAAPASVAMLQFAEIQARARARKAPRRVFTMRRLTALGWAATIVMAAGIGWIARGSIRFGTPRADRLSGPAATAAAAPAEAAVHDSLATGVPGGREAQGGAALSQAAPPPPAADAVTPKAAPRAATEEVQAPAAAPVQAPARAEARTAAVGNLAEREQPAAAKAAAPEGIPTRQAVAGIIVIADEPRDALGRSEVAVDSAANEFVQRVDHALRENSWAGTTAQDAERHLGESLHTVDGLPVESIRIGAVEGTPAVAVVQILPGGEQMEIVQWRTADAEGQAMQLQMAEEAPQAQAAVAPADAVRRAEVVAMRNDVVVVMRAPIAADSLAVLAAKVR